MAIEGYPIHRDVSGISVVPSKRILRNGDQFAERFPPQTDDELFAVVKGIRAETGFIFEELVDPNGVEGRQIWRFGLKK